MSSKKFKKPNMMDYKVGDILVNKKEITVYKDTDKTPIIIPIGKHFTVVYFYEYEYCNYYELSILKSEINSNYNSNDSEKFFIVEAYDDGEDGILQMYFKKIGE